MVDTQQALIEALRANDERPHGRQRTVTAEELAEAAEQFDDPGLLASALLELMEAYEYDAEQRKMPVVFARILKLWDSKPDEFSDWARGQVFWRFKWVASALLSVPDVPLEAIRRWHSEMRERYRAAQYALQPYYAQRFHLAAHTGEDADTAFDLWASRSRARLSDCEACETRAKALYHQGAGDDARALEVWRPVLEQESTCSEEPYNSQAHALLALLRQGRTDQARSAHLVGYRFARGKAGMAAQVGLHLEFCALSGNEARGLEILAENRDLFAMTGNPLARLEFLTGVEVLLALLDGHGHGELAVSGPPGANWTVTALLEHVRAEAGALAARFDARNGTDAVGGHRLARLAQRPLLAEPLTLGVRTAATLTPVIAPAVAPAAEEIPEEFGALVRRARELATVSHPESHALWHRIGDRLTADGLVVDPELGSVELLRAELTEQRAFDAFDQRDSTLGCQELAAAEAMFEQLGLPARALAHRVRQRVAELDASDGKPDWAEFDGWLRQAEELFAAGRARPEDFLTVLHCRAFAAHLDLVAGLPEPTPQALQRHRAEVGRYHRESGERDIAHRMVTACQYLADAAARQGRFDEAETELRKATELLEGAGLPWRAPRVLGLLAQVKMQQDEQAAAIPVIHRALAEAARWESDSYPFAQTYVMLGHACLHADDPSGAIRALSEGAARFDREGKADDAAQARLQLSDVLTQSGRVADAVAVLESVLLDGGAAELDERLAAQLRLDLARGLCGLEEYRDGAEEFLRLADAVAGWEDQDTHTMVACEAAVALAHADRREAAEAARERALASHARAPRADQVCSMLREFAKLTVSTQGPEGLEQALALLDQADSVREQAEADGDPVNSWYQLGAVHYERGRSYGVAERPEEALAELELAIADYEQGGPEGEQARAEAVRIAALVEGNTLGRPDAARARLTAAIPRCEQAGLPEAARILSTLRDRFADPAA